MREKVHQFITIGLLTCPPMSEKLNPVSDKALNAIHLAPPPDSLVCIVDDEESFRRSLSRLFRSVRMPAETFGSAQAYLERAAHSGPSCLILDVCMPGLGGLELQQALTNRHAQI